SIYRGGRPRPPTPGKPRPPVAARRGWPVQRFDSRNRSESKAQLRTVVGLASLVPVSGLGVAVGLLKRNKRSALNFAAPLWLDVVFRVNGVKLEVAGRENL